MCYHTAHTSNLEALKKRFKAKKGSDDFTPTGKTSGFDHPNLPVILNESTDVIQLITWGLMPAWASPEQAKLLVNQTLNAKAETVFEKPSFKTSILTKRCLVLVDGFYEWQHVGKNRNEFFINLKDNQPFAMGGIWAEWIHPLTSEIVKSFSIITTEANPLMATIHNIKKRMPLILDKSVESSWLRSDLTHVDIQSIMTPFDENKMQAKEVNPPVFRQIDLFG